MDKISMSIKEKLLEAPDHEVLIDFQLNRKCRADVRLKSLSTSATVAFKVQTSSPHKFLVKPPSGLIPPSSSTTLQIVLKPQSSLPTSFPRSPADRFLIKCAEFNANSAEVNQHYSIGSWLSSPQQITQDVKLKVAFGGRLLLHHAVSRGDVDAARGLIKRQKTIVSELQREDAESLVRVATESENAARMINLLMEAGLRVDSCGESNDRVEAVRSCGEAKNAGPSDKIDSKLSPVRELSRMDRDIPTSDDCGPSTTHLLPDKEASELPKQGEEVLMAARTGDTTRLTLLLRGGATTNFRDQYGLTPLHAAAIKGHTEAAGLLLEFGADINSRDDEGHVPLHLAAELGSLDAVEALIEKGASINVASKSGVTPLYIAKVMGHGLVSELLVKKGATSPKLPFM